MFPNSLAKKKNCYFEHTEFDKPMFIVLTSPPGMEHIAEDEWEFETFEEVIREGNSFWFRI